MFKQKETIIFENYYTNSVLSIQNTKLTHSSSLNLQTQKFPTIDGQLHKALNNKTYQSKEILYMKKIP